MSFTKALVNSTITANMNFTKTSPKFGQWSDHRANTVFGLGFSSERDLNQVRARLVWMVMLREEALLCLCCDCLIFYCVLLPVT